MSACRQIPYGYRMRNGKIEIHPDEAEIVLWIYRRYTDGIPLAKIAAQLCDKHIEYLPGEYSWNKNRIKRILEDKRYTGQGDFGKIIDPDTQNQANALKNMRNTQKGTSLTRENKLLVHSTLCGVCGEKMYHKTDRRLKNAERWSCYRCGLANHMPLAEIEKQVVDRFNMAIASPELCGAEDYIDYVPTQEIRRLENEIARKTEKPDEEREEVMQCILQCAAAKYAACNDKQYITQRLKADFGKRGPLSVFSAELYQTAAEATLLYPDGTIGVRLKNQTILK